MRLSGCRGFTITELVIAFLLVGIAITISLSLVGNWRGQYQFSGMVNSFQSAVNLSRSRAIARQDTVKLIIKMKSGADVLSATEDSTKTNPLKTWKDRGKPGPAYGSEDYFVLDHQLDVATGRDKYGQEIWFYCDSAAYNVTITPAKTAPGDLVLLQFDPRGFAVDPNTGDKTGYTVTISHPPTDSKQEVSFTVSPLGRIKQGGAS